MPDDRPEKERAFLKPRGRPCKLDAKVLAAVVKHLKHGSYLETAAAAAGVGKATLYVWLNQAKADDLSERVNTPFQEFRDAVEQAQAEAETKDLARISKAADKGNWNAAAWRLERRNPKRWAPAKRFVEEDDEDRNTFELNYSLEEDK